MSNDTAHPALHLPPRYLKIVQGILRRYLPQAEVWAYGSRVNGDRYEASDLDLVVRQPDDLTRPQPGLDEGAAAFSESDLPILVQIVDWARIPEAFFEEIEAGYVVLQPADGAPAAATDPHSLAPTLQRGIVVGPLQRPVSSNRTSPPARRDAGASSLAPTLERGSQTMQSKWLSHLVAELQDDGILLVEDGNHGEYRPRSDEFGQGDYAFIRAADMDGGRVLFESAQLINDTAVKRIRKGIGRGGDVLFSHKGTVGKLALVPLDAPAFVCSPQTTFWRTLNEQTLDRRYLYYFMCSRAFTDQWMARSNETDMAAYVSLTAQRQLSVALPEIAVQRDIADVLGALDDKIEQNRRTAEALERLARAIFHAWFVDFEPVKAKAAGANSFPSMPQPVFDAIPTRLVDSGIGLIPEGWRVKALSGVCTLVSGGTPKRSETAYWGGSIPWYSVKDAPSDGEIFVIKTADKITEQGLSNSAAKLVPKGCTIISARGTVGKLAMAGTPLAFNQSCYGLLPGDDKSFCYLHLLLQTAVAELQQRTHGSVFDTITRATFDGLLVVSPREGAVSAFEILVTPLFDALL